MAEKPKKITKRQVQAHEGRPHIPHVEARPEIDEDDAGDDGLTNRQRLFVAALVGPARLNATKAAEMAGYRSDNRVALASTASENLRKPQIQEAIALALAKKRATPEWAKASLVDLAASSMANFVSVGDDGEPQIDFAKAAAAGAIGQLKEFTADVLPGPEGERKVIRCKIKVHDRAQALGMLMKLFGLIDADDRAAPDVEIALRPLSGGRVRAKPTPADPQYDEHGNAD